MNILTISVLVILIILLLSYSIRNKVAGVLSGTFHPLVIVFTLITLTGLFLPGIYTYLAEQTLQGLGITSTIDKLDEAFVLDDLTSQSSDVIDDISNLFSGEEDSGESISTTIFKDTLHSPFVNALTLLYRILAVVLSLFGLAGTLYISYGTAGLTQVYGLKKRVEKLEAQQRG